MLGSIIEFGQIEAAAVPIDTTSAAVAGDWMSFANYDHCDIVIIQGAWAGGTPAVTLDEAKTNAGGDTQDLSFTYYYSKTALTGTTWAKTAVTSDTFNLTAVANIITVIPIDADHLDVDDDYDFFQLSIASPGANADLICAMYLFSRPRFAGASAVSAQS